MRKFLIFLLLCVFTQVYAAELFGVNLSGATRDQLRVAVKNAGLKLIQEAGSDGFYDIYKGDSVLYKANHLYLGFVKKDKKFAFAEYEFNGLKHPAMLKRLKSKYGPASLGHGEFITDQSYSWISEGIFIKFYQDWDAYKMRLTYSKPEALQLLRNEQKKFQINTNQLQAGYMEQAY